MGNGLSIKVNFPTDKEIKEMFDAPMLFDRYEALQDAVAAGAEVILARAKQLAPRGTQSDRSKRSKAQKASANWNVQLHTTLSLVNRGGRKKAFAIIGPSHPYGNKAYFNSPRSGERKHKLWGRDVGRIRKATRNWMVQAFDETRPQQLSAMKTAITAKINEMMLK